MWEPLCLPATSAHICCVPTILQGRWIHPLTEELLWQERAPQPEECRFHSRSPLPQIAGKKARGTLVLQNSEQSLAPVSIEASRGAARGQSEVEPRKKGCKGPSGPSFRSETSGAREAQDRMPERLPFQLAPHELTIAVSPTRADMPEGMLAPREVRMRVTFLFCFVFHGRSSASTRNLRVFLCARYSRHWTSGRHPLACLPTRCGRQKPCRMVLSACCTLQVVNRRENSSVPRPRARTFSSENTALTPRSDQDLFRWLRSLGATRGSLPGQTHLRHDHVGFDPAPR
jgi:hypothetical protein